MVFSNRYCFLKGFREHSCFIGEGNSCISPTIKQVQCKSCRERAEELDALPFQRRFYISCAPSINCNCSYSIAFKFQMHIFFSNNPYCNIAISVKNWLGENIGHWADIEPKQKKYSAQWLPKLCMLFPTNSFSTNLAYLPLNDLMCPVESCDSNFKFKVIQASYPVFLPVLNLSTMSFMSFNS